MCVVYNVIAKCKCLAQLPTPIFTVARLLSTNINDDVAQSRLRLVFAKSHERRPVSLTASLCSSHVCQPSEGWRTNKQTKKQTKRTNKQTKHTSERTHTQTNDRTQERANTQTNKRINERANKHTHMHTHTRKSTDAHAQARRTIKHTHTRKYKTF